MAGTNFSDSFDKRDPEFIRSMMPAWEWLSKYYFRCKSSGWHNLPEEKCLIVGSHNGGISSPDLGLFMYDWFKRFGTDRAIHGLMHPMMWKGLTAMAKSAEKFGAVPAHPRYAFEAFKRDAPVLVPINLGRKSNSNAIWFLRRSESKLWELFSINP
ncbi:hypothetical protein N9Y60_05920 [Crocinitomicaceae bacterium]|nr:hypothetical protein [Crocinitomicaceae bacterium]